MDPLMLLLAALMGSAAITVAGLAVTQATRWSRRARYVHRLIAQRERETDEAVVAELDEQMASAISRLASMSLVTKTWQGWALIFAAILFFVSGAVATTNGMASADPAQGTSALTFTTLCLVLGAVALVVEDRLLEGQRIAFMRRTREGNEPA